jgi:L-ribulokinase
MCLPHTTFQPDVAAAPIYERLFTLYRKCYFALGSHNADSCSLGDVLPELRLLAAQARQTTN